MSAADGRAKLPTATTDPPETQDLALIRCEHDRATLARMGKPTGLVFETLDCETLDRETT